MAGLVLAIHVFIASKRRRRAAKASLVGPQNPGTDKRVGGVNTGKL
jgi:hypothetical protein